MKNEKSSRRVSPVTYDIIENARRLDVSLGRDVVMWRHDEDVYKDHFSSARTWDQIRIICQEVLWYQLVWYTQEFLAKISLYGWQFEIDSLLEFVRGVGNYSKMCFLWRKRRKLGPLIFCLSYHLYYLLSQPIYWELLLIQTGRLRSPLS